MARCFYCWHCGNCGPGSYDPRRFVPGKCPSCGVLNDSGDGVCGGCGKRLPPAAGVSAGEGRKAPSKRMRVPPPHG